MKVVIENLVLCIDCTMAAVNDDYTGVEDYYRVHKGLAMLGPGLVPEGEYDEFSTRRCDCCGSHLAGARHYFCIIS